MKPILTASATFPRTPRRGGRVAWRTGLLLALLAGPAWSQTQPRTEPQTEPETPPPPSAITLELNAAAAIPAGGCRLTLVVTNALPTGLSRAAWQVAVFDKAGAVQSLPVLDFGALLAGKTKVVQFALPGAGCDQIGRIVLNDVAQCAGQDGSDQREACLTGLATSNRSDIRFGL